MDILGHSPSGHSPSPEVFVVQAAWPTPVLGAGGWGQPPWKRFSRRKKSLQSFPELWSWSATIPSRWSFGRCRRDHSVAHGTNDFVRGDHWTNILETTMEPRQMVLIFFNCNFFPWVHVCFQMTVTKTAAVDGGLFWVFQGSSIPRCFICSSDSSMMPLSAGRGRRWSHHVPNLWSRSRWKADGLWMRMPRSRGASTIWTERVPGKLPKDTFRKET